jgi:mannosylglucosylglycerate synthase
MVVSSCESFYILSTIYIEANRQGRLSNKHKMDGKNDHKRIGFISTRFSGTDGVSLEAAKWVETLEALGHECTFFAGKSDWAEERSYEVPEAHLAHPDIQALTIELFERHNRSRATSEAVVKLTRHLKKHLQRFIKRFNPHVLIVENALSLPMNIPLGLAITEITAETCIPVIAHHHDFAWERERYAVASAADYLRAAFPPTLEQVHHVVINSYAKQQLALNAGVSSTVIPNVMDFDQLPPQPDEYCNSFRKDLEIASDQFILLQPTRIIPRKRIEKAIELTRRLELDCILVVTHDSGDEGHDYKTYLQDYASLLGVDMRLAGNRCAPKRGCTPDGKQVYSLFDVYQQANLVTYPSQLEGFGNALLEAIYYRKPILTSTYRILKTDIQPKGFEFIEFDDYFRPDFLRRVREVLLNPCSVEGIVEHNFETGRQFYSYSVLEEQLVNLLNTVTRGAGCNGNGNVYRKEKQYSC